jgi:hypothetical protein
MFPDGLEVTDEIVMKQLRSFNKGTASGRSGWSVNHFLECAYPQTGVPRFLEALVSVVNLFLSGKALQSFATFMASASLVPLLKKDGSIRPIAVGEILFFFFFFFFQDYCI